MKWFKFILILLDKFNDLITAGLIQYITIGNKPELYLYGHISLIIDKFYYQQLNMYKIPRDFQLQLRKINTPPHTPPTPLPPPLQSYFIYFICCYILVFSCYIFVNFWVAMALTYFLCQAMALVCFFSRKENA